MWSAINPTLELRAEARARLISAAKSWDACHDAAEPAWVLRWLWLRVLPGAGLRRGGAGQGWIATWCGVWRVLCCCGRCAAAAFHRCCNEGPVHDQARDALLAAGLSVQWVRHPARCVCQAGVHMHYRALNQQLQVMNLLPQSRGGGMVTSLPAE
jgi:hypothetical protein